MKHINIALSVLLVATLSGCAHTQANHYENSVGKPPVVKQVAKNTMSWDGATLPEYPKGQPEVTILHITIPPGTRLPLHHHPVINAGVLLEGKLTVIKEDGTKLKMTKGDPIIELVNTPHYGINESNEPAVILVVYAGIKGKPVTVLNK